MKLPNGKVRNRSFWKRELLREIYRVPVNELRHVSSRKPKLIDRRLLKITVTDHVTKLLIVDSVMGCFSRTTCVRSLSRCISITH